MSDKLNRILRGEFASYDGMRVEVITLDEGDVTVRFPDNISAVSLSDLDEHFTLLLGRIRRRLPTPPTEPVE